MEDKDLLQKILDLQAEGLGQIRISKKLDITRGKVRHLLNEQKSKTTISTESEVHWSEWLKPMVELQNLSTRASFSSYTTQVDLDTDKPICLIFLSDLHIGSRGTDYELFVKITKEVIEIENLYVILGGDEVDFAIKLRSVAEVHGNTLTPEQQLSFLSSWVHDIKHKVLGACAGNHDAHRTDAQAGINPFGRIFKPIAPYSPGIFHMDLKIGEIVYKIAMSHYFKGRSMYNRLHSQKRYSREEAPEADIIMAGHTHQPAFAFDVDGGKEKVYINSGSIQTNSSYAKRFHSLQTFPIYPCVVLFPDRKEIIPLKNVTTFINFNKFYK